MDIRAYVSIARPDHWFKNVFMLLGVLLAFFVQPVLISKSWLLSLSLAIFATCLVASSNYVINEILDASRDRLHPKKSTRPIPSGRVYVPAAFAEWLILAAIGLGVSFTINLPFFLSALALWIAGLLYNIPPIRTKDIPYVDVLSESINNPIRLFLGWFAFIPGMVPPVSLTLAYWLGGAFFMGAKRFAEYRMINNVDLAGKYRSSFKYYDEDKLLLSLFFYSTGCSFFFAIFIIRYHLELILSAPLIAGFFAYYVKVMFRPDSPVQNPEKLYREFGFISYAVLSVIVFVFLLYTSIPALYDLFNISPSKMAPLWVF